MAREIFAKHHAENRLFCYTDGSKTDTAVGTAFWFPTLKAKGGGSLEQWSSIVTAELMGIKLAAEWMAEWEVQGDVMVVTDSKSAIQALLTTRPVAEVRKDCWDIMKLITERYQRQGGKIFLQWVPSHRGIAGNEYVDNLAGEARDQPRAGPQFIEFRELKKELKRVCERRWQREWDEDPRGRYRHEVDPHLHKGRTVWERRDNNVFFHSNETGGGQ